MSTSGNMTSSAIILLVMCQIFIPTISTASTEQDRNNTTTKICEYSRQLQDPSIRKQYLDEIGRAVINENKNNQAEEEQEEESILTFLRITDRNTPKENNHKTIDEFSVKCLTCHDEVNARMGEVIIKDNPGNKRIRQLASNHPIGMTYDRYASYGKGFKRAALLNSNIILFDGKVGCLTCHNPINPEKRHLVMSDAKSALCLTCHDK